MVSVTVIGSIISYYKNNNLSEWISQYIAHLFCVYTTLSGQKVAIMLLENKNQQSVE